MRRLLLSVLGLILVFSLTSSPVLGQQSHSSPSLSLPETISAGELNAAANLYAEIETIYAVHETKLMRPTSAKVKETIKTKREKAIERAIQLAPLSATEYDAILEQAAEHEHVNKRLKKRIRKARDR